MPKFTISALIFLLALSCTSTPPAQPPQSEESAPTGLTVDEEAGILQLEDRRMFDDAVASAWAIHPNAPHRARIALALGRIGTATFLDANGNGEKDSNESNAGIEILNRLALDSDPMVRRNVAFALGEIGDPSGIETLVKLADDREHAGIASEAIEALTKLGALTPLARYSRYTQPDLPIGLRARAARFLFRFNNDESSLLAVALLTDASPEVRAEAAYSLSRRPHASAREALEKLAWDPDAITRSFSVRTLGAIGDRRSYGLLVSALGDVHPWVRTNALRALAQVITNDPTAVDREELPTDVARVITTTEDPDPGTRTASIETLGLFILKNEQARNRILQIAVDGSPWMREQATLVIARQLGDTPDNPLDALLQTDSRWIKIRAIEGTSSLVKGRELRSRFAADSDPSVRAAAIGAIPDDRVDAEIAIVRAALGDADPVVRATAVDRLAIAKNEPLDQKVSALRSVEQSASSESQNDARLSAISTLATLEFPERETFLHALVHDRDPVVRRVAADAIAERLGKSRPQFTPLPSDRSLEDYKAIVEWSRSPHTATIHMTRGKIELVLLAQEAPMTAKNFADLAQRGFFNGTSFMRVVPNFVIQGGDPRNDMSGGPGYAIRDEINLQRYTRGAVGMALSGPDTGGSQFFITHSRQHHLDGGYTIFARVVSGMSGVVDQTERGDRVEKITIDERPPGKPDFAAVERTPLPIETGATNPERLLLIPEYR